MVARHVLLLSNEPATVNAVSSAMESNGKLAAEDVCREVPDLAWRLEHGHSSAVLVDIDPEPHRTLLAIEPLVRRFNNTRFVVLSAAMHNELLLHAMRAGARHFLLKEAIVSDLHGILKQVCSNHENDFGGSAVTVLSAGGGCGATTIAVNLAAELNPLGENDQDEPSLVVDLDPHYGAVAAYLGVEGNYGLFDLLGRTGMIDAELIQSTALKYSDSLHTLISAPRGRLGEPMAIDPERLGLAIDACKSAYSWTVIDAPRISSLAAAELVRRSTTTLLLLQLTVKDIRTARWMLTALADKGVPTQSIKVLATRYRRRRQLVEPEEARQALGLTQEQSLGFLANDFYAVTEAVNLGKTLAQISPRSDLRRDLRKLAATISSTRKTARVELE